jgi:hypothetical protein
MKSVLPVPEVAHREDSADYRYFAAVHRSFSTLVPLLRELKMRAQTETVTKLLELCAVHAPTLIHVRLGSSSEIARFCAAAEDLRGKMRTFTEGDARLLRQLVKPMIERLERSLHFGVETMRRNQIARLAAAAQAGDIYEVVERWEAADTNVRFLFEGGAPSLPIQVTARLVRMADPNCPCCQALLLHKQAPGEVRMAQVTKQMIAEAPERCACRVALANTRPGKDTVRY